MSLALFRRLFLLGATASGLVLLAASASARSREAGIDEPRPPVLASSQRWVSAAELYAVAERAVAQVLQARGARAELSMPRDAGRGVTVDAGQVELVARALPAEMAWSPRMAVWVDVVQGDAPRRSVLVPVQVRAWRPGWVALRDMPAGTRLSDAWLRQDEVDVAAGGQPAWQGDPQGLVLRSPAVAGRYLAAQQVAAPHAVARGERVELVHRLGAVDVLADASALQDGEIGQHVQVRVAAAQGPVLARVIAPGRVELLK